MPYMMMKQNRQLSLKRCVITLSRRKLCCLFVFQLITTVILITNDNEVSCEKFDHEWYVEPLYDHQPVVTSSFLVRLKPSETNKANQELAHMIAKRHGFVNYGPIARSTDTYHFEHPMSHASSVLNEKRNIKTVSSAGRQKRSLELMKKLKKEPKVEHVVQQIGFKRSKRGYKQLPELAIPKLFKVKSNETSKVEQAAAQKVNPTDPYFQYQWWIENNGQSGGIKGLDLNVKEAWAAGKTGKGITIAIMDDGIDYMHLDLKDNYNAEASVDWSSNDKFPYPRYTDDWFNSHGTRCAGEIVSKRDNGICGAGIAYDARVAGIRMLDQPYMTDMIEANSMSYMPNDIHIYSASWGPTDNGRTVDGPRNATMHAIVNGINEGRNGKGSIYVWASGDGGSDDDCNCDGYAASMWTISINSAINTGANAHYDESCSSTLASTFSNGAKDPRTGVATTDLYDRCTQTHSGTSAAAPEAAGVYALALEANQNLTWRDIQHLTVLTSKRNSLFDDKNRFDWKVNGVGLEYNHLFGFGVLDAGAMVALAENWKSVPARYHCDAGLISSQSHEILDDGKGLELTIDTDACKGSKNKVNFIEHVQAILTVNSTRRGDLTLFLTSPMGTESMILNRRPLDDDNKNGFVRWPFMTTQTWGESPQGRWTLRAKFYDVPTTNSTNSTTKLLSTHQVDLNSTNSTSSSSLDKNNQLSIKTGKKLRSGFIKEWRLMIHGTAEMPYKNIKLSDSNSKLAIVNKRQNL